MGASVICFLVCTYYVMIMGWTVYYFILSFSPKHPWINYVPEDSVTNETDPNAYFS